MTALQESLLKEFWYPLCREQLHIQNALGHGTIDVLHPAVEQFWDTRIPKVLQKATEMKKSAIRVHIASMIQKGVRADVF